MKKVLLLGLSAMLAVAATAQNEQIHVFRTDKAFNSFKAADIESITYAGDNDGFSKMLVNKLDNTAEVIDMNLIDSVSVHQTGLPEFFVTLNDYPELDDLITSYGKEFVYSAQIYMKGNGMFDDLPEQTVEFRGRGNSTWNMPKKPYRFKMSKKTSVCGLAKAKTFALIANFIDNTLMRNTIALWTANYLEMPFANHCIPVKVYINGNLKGQYMLTEKIGTGSGSVDIDETTGMLFELDSNYDENYKFSFNLNTYAVQDQTSSNALPVMVKDPDLDELYEEGDLGEYTPTEYFALWKDDMAAMLKAVMTTPTSGSLSDYIDLDQAVNYFIVNSLAANHEMKHPKSFYIHKASREPGERYVFGPVWDFDWAFTFDGTEGAQSARYNQPLVGNVGDCGGYRFLKALFANQEFRTLYKQKWDDFVANGFPQLLEYIDQYAYTIEPSAKENGLLWGYYNGGYYQVNGSWDFRNNLETLKTWLKNRVDFCSSNANFGLY